MTAAVVAGVIKVKIADKDARLVAKQDRWNALQRIREARAKDPNILKVPGGDTGFVTVYPRV